MNATRLPPDATEREDGAVVLPTAFQAPAPVAALSVREALDVGETAFSRADLIVEGVSHESSSYQVRVFLNNPEAGAETPRTADVGYAGKFTIFGHGGCFGASGHCDIQGAPVATEPAAMALAMPHPLTPQTKTVTITGPLKEVLERDGGLTSITFVPIRKAPRRSDSGPAAGLFSATKVRIETYR